MRHHKKQLLTLILLVLMSVSFPYPSSASAARVLASADEGSLILIKTIVVNGQEQTEVTATQVQVIRAGTNTTEPAKAGMLLNAGDKVITGDGDVQATLLFLNAAAGHETEVILFSGTQVKVGSLFTYAGKIWAKVKGLFDCTEEGAKEDAKGTEFEVEVVTRDGNTEYITTVLEGIVNVEKGDFSRLAKDVTRRNEAIDRLLPVAYRNSPTSALTAPALPEPTSKIEIVPWQVITFKVGPSVANTCKQPHSFEAQKPENVAGFNRISPQPVIINGGASALLSVELQIDTARLVTGAPFHVDLVIKCLDCNQEPGCAGDQTVPLDFRGPAAQVLAVPRLKQVKITKTDPLPENPVDISEKKVQSVLDWTSKVILASQPDHPAENILPSFTSHEDRKTKFKEARYKAIYKQDPGGYETLGNIYKDWGDGIKAVEAYKKAVETNPNANPDKPKPTAYLTNLGEAYRMIGKLDEAQSHLDQIPEADRNSPPVLNALGNLYYDKANAAIGKGDTVEAKAHIAKAKEAYTRALGEIPGGRTLNEQQKVISVVTQNNLGYASLTSGNIAQQEEQIEDAKRQYQEAEQQFKKAENQDSKYSVFKKAGRQVSKYPYVYTGLGEAYHAQGILAQRQEDPLSANRAYAEAERVYKEAIRNAPKLTTAYLGLGNLNKDRSAVDDKERSLSYKQEAVRNYELAIKYNPKNATPYYYLKTLLVQEDDKKANRYEATFTKLDPGPQTRYDFLKGGPTGKYVLVPKLIGLTASEALKKLKQSNLLGKQESQQVEGRVADQIPKAGKLILPGSEVTIILTKIDK